MSRTGGHRQVATRVLLAAIAAWLALGHPAVADGAVFCVADAAGLESALEAAAANGLDDEIRLRPGTYAGAFAFPSADYNTLSLSGGWSAGCAASEPDPSMSVLAGVSPASRVLDASGNGIQLLLSNLTVSHGNGGPGIAVDSYYGMSISLQDCVISGNGSDSSTATGAGLLGVNGSGRSVVIDRCVFADNRGGDGAAMKLTAFSSIAISRSVFTGNQSSGVGGAAYIPFCTDLSIVDSTMSGNQADGQGGALFVYGRSVAISSSRITGNSAGVYGAMRIEGDYNKFRSITLVNNLIAGNQSASDFGAGMFLSHRIWLTNNTIVGNTASGSVGGMGLLVRNAEGSVWNETMRGMALVHNNIFRSNVAESGVPDLVVKDLLYIGRYPTVTVMNNLLAAGGLSVIYQAFVLDPSNIDADPLFLDAGAGDYRLADGSPCLDTGDNVAPGIPAADISGRVRPINGIVDMGAWEHPLAPPAAAPVIAATDALHPGHVVVSWADLADEDGYRVYRRATGVDPWAQLGGTWPPGRHPSSTPSTATTPSSLPSAGFTVSRPTTRMARPCPTSTRGRPRPARCTR